MRRVPRCSTRRRFRSSGPGAVTCDVYTRSWWDCTEGFSYWDDFVLTERDLSDRGSLRATYQAESASVKSQCTTSTARPDYTGSGYLVPSDNTAYVQWNNVNAGGGERILVIRYSMEAGSPKWDLLVNGASKGQKTPLPTSSPESWATIALGSREASVPSTRPVIPIAGRASLPATGETTAGACS